MRVTHSFGVSGFQPGSYWKECARCGFDFRIEELKEDGVTKALVCPSCYDPKHPLDKKREA